MKRAFGNGHRPWYRTGNAHPSHSKDRPVASMSGNDNEDTTIGDSVTLDIDENCKYIGWKLYFPALKYSKSPDIIKKLKAMESHFETFSHWYDFAAIQKSSVLDLNLEYLVDDEELKKNWPNWYDDFHQKPTESLACVGLAAHKMIMDKFKCNETSLQIKKIYVRPTRWRPITKLSNISNTTGQMVSTIGTISAIEPIHAKVKIMCFLCSHCKGHLLVKQINMMEDELTKPSKCRKNCTAKSGFMPLMTSPFTVILPKQKVILQETCFVANEVNRSVEAFLTGDQVNSMALGQRVILTGIMKYIKQKQSFDAIKANMGKGYESYMKVFSAQTLTGPAMLQQEPNIDRVEELVATLKADPMIFKLLVHSLCPDVVGRDEAKAAIVLSLMSGNDLVKNRRSNCHVMLLGNPGTGKSTLIMAAAAVSPRGMFLCGPTITQGGLTGSIGSEGKIEAGALVLCDNGVCCIDELDKFTFAHSILLESMEQQVVSVAKHGTLSNAPTRCSIIAAANPAGGVYNPAKTVAQNITFSACLISRFDLIIPFIESSQPNHHQLIEKMHNKGHDDGEMEFFDSTKIPRFSEKSHWFRSDPDEKIQPVPKHIMKLYIEYAREKCHPRLSPEAVEELKKFFMEYKSMCTLNDKTCYGSKRQFISLLRLTLAKARAELKEVATRKDALQAIYLFKCSQIDYFAAENNQPSTSRANNTQLFNYTKQMKAPNVSTMSVPKQKKAFYQLLQEKVESEDRNNFLLSEMKEFGKELGIKNVTDLIDRIYIDGGLLKTADGYRVV